MNNGIQVDEAVSKNKKKTRIMAVVLILIVAAGLGIFSAKQAALNNEKIALIKEWLVGKTLTTSDITSYLVTNGVGRSEFRSSYSFHADQRATREYYVAEGRIKPPDLTTFLGKEGKDWHITTTYSSGTWDALAAAGDIMLSVKLTDDETGKAINCKPIIIKTDSEWNIVSITSGNHEFSWTVTE